MGRTDISFLGSIRFYMAVFAVCIIIIPIIHFGVMEITNTKIELWERFAAPSYILNETAMHVKIEDLIHDWSADHILANEKYSGKHLVVYGVYKGQEEGYIYLGSESKWFSPILHVRLRALEFPEIDIDEKVKAEGVLQGGEFFSFLLLNHAQLIENK